MREGLRAWEIAAFVGLLFVVRGILVLSLGDVFFYAEELAKGAAAVAIRSDLGVEHHRLAYLYYEGGGFVVSHLNALAFWLVGPNVLALKLVALGLCSAVLCAGLGLAGRLFGRPAAVLFGLLFVFAPASFQKLSLLALGIHFEALFFVLAVLYFTARALFEEDARPSRWFLFGLASGFGTYFSYSVAPAVAYCACVLLLLRSALSLRCAKWGIGGFLVGFAPWIWMWSRVGREVFDIHGHEGGLEGWELLLAHADALTASASPLQWSAMALTALVIGVGVLQAPRARILFCAAYALVFTGVYFFSGFGESNVLHYVYYKRLSQPWILFTLICAAVLARWMASDRGLERVLARAAAALLICAGAFNTLAIARASPATSLAQSWHLLTHVKGYYWGSYLGALASHLEGDSAAKVRTLARLEEPDRGYLYPAIAERLWRDGKGELSAIVAACQTADPQHTSAFLAGLGAWWHRHHGGELADRLDAVLRLPPEQRSAMRRAIARDEIGVRVNMRWLERHVARARDERLPDEYLVALGYSMHLVIGLGADEGRALWQELPALILHPAEAEAFLARLDSKSAGLMRAGWDQALRDRTLP